MYRNSIKKEGKEDVKMLEFLDKNNAEQRREFEEFASNHPNGCFMQSLKWADVKCSWAYEGIIVRDKERRVTGTALVLIRRIPIIGRSLLYAPHGPVCDYRDRETLSEIFKGIEILRKKHKGYQFISDPCVTENDVLTINMFRSFGFRYMENAPELSTIQARNNYMLKINGRDINQIFDSFHKKWRYNIRVAVRKGVECRVCGKEALDDFYGLMTETGKRDGFDIRSYEYFERMLDCLGEHCRLYMCYYNGVPLSGAIAVQYAGKTCYVYGASTERNRNVMPNYLMQWSMICWAVASGCQIYDFQGIPFYNDENHPNYGVYRFKKGFNGEVVTYAGEFCKCYNRPLKHAVKFAGRVYRRIIKKNPAELLGDTNKKHDIDDIDVNNRVIANH